MEATLLSKVILPIALFIIMLGMGLSLALGDFRMVAKSRKSVLVGLTGQMLFLPLLAFALATAFGLEAQLAVGFMVLAFCPGGVTSNVFYTFRWRQHSVVHCSHRYC